MNPTTTGAKPSATTTIEPMGRRTKIPRDHLIKVMLTLSTIDAKHTDKGHVASVARQSLESFSPPRDQPDRRKFVEVSVASKFGKPGSAASVVIGVEGSVIWAGRPEDDSVQRLRAALLGEGYRVAAVRETRECAEPSCTTEAIVDWDRPKAVPSGWYSNLTCGKHHYRTCSKCKSLYVLTSTNSVGQAPSVHCGVCGTILIEWGSSKVWEAELVTKGESAG